MGSRKVDETSLQLGFSLPVTSEPLYIINPSILKVLISPTLLLFVNSLFWVSAQMSLPEKTLLIGSS